MLAEALIRPLPWREPAGLFCRGRAWEKNGFELDNEDEHLKKKFTFNKVD